jgi:hypothetical protein
VSNRLFQAISGGSTRDMLSRLFLDSLVACAGTVRRVSSKWIRSKWHRAADRGWSGMTMNWLASVDEKLLAALVGGASGLTVALLNNLLGPYTPRPSPRGAGA